MEDVEPKVLIVEDDPTLLETLEYSLKRQGYEVYTAADGRVALEIARQERPDALILDVMLPGLDGFEVCRILRREMNVPILMLTARADEVDKIVGLEVGADDYMTKPFSMRELVARVKAMLRRVRLMREEFKASAPQPAPEAQPVIPQALVFGNLTIDLDRREVRLNEQPLALKPREFDLLLYLAQHRGSVLTR